MKENRGIILRFVRYLLNRNTFQPLDTEPTSRSQRPYTEDIQSQTKFHQLCALNLFCISPLTMFQKKSTSLRCFVLGYLLQSGTHVSRQLKRKQEKYNSDRQRNQSFACHAKSLALVKDKIERYFQPKPDNEVCCVKGMNIHPLQNLTLKKIFIQQCAPVTYLSAAPAENLDVLHASNRIYCTLFHNF